MRVQGGRTQLQHSPAAAVQLADDDPSVECHNFTYCDPEPRTQKGVKIAPAHASESIKTCLAGLSPRAPSRKVLASCNNTAAYDGQCDMQLEHCTRLPCVWHC